MKDELRYAHAMETLKVRVESGKIVGEAPSGFSEGTELELVLADPRDSQDHRIQVLNGLSTSLDAISRLITEGEEDLHHLQLAFAPFKNVVLDRLWELYEHSDPPRRRIALMIRLAVRSLSSYELTEKHLQALSFLVECLSKGELSREDITACKRQLRGSGIDPVMSLGDQRERLLEIYHTEID